MVFKAIIFDFDGVITDTEPVHMQAWLHVFGPLNINFSKQEYDQNYLGLNDRDFLDAVGKIHKRPFPDDEKTHLIAKKLLRTLELLRSGVPLIEGVKEFVESRSGTCRFAICSGANKSEIHFVLKKLGWLELFDPIVTQEDVKNGKPSPEGYNLVLNLINEASKKYPIVPQECLVVEDSPKGIAAARAAGMRCLAISTSFPPDKLKDAEWITKSLTEFNLR